MLVVKATAGTAACVAGTAGAACAAGLRKLACHQGPMGFRGCQPKKAHDTVEVEMPGCSWRTSIKRPARKCGL